MSNLKVDRVPRKREHMTIYCDGGCRANGKYDSIGGYGIIKQYLGEIEEMCGAEVGTTNNRMELIACIEALKSVEDKHIPVQIITDSKYVVLGLSEWRFNWEKNNWLTHNRTEVKNKDLWLELISLVEEFDIIGIQHCYGHSTTEGNNRADELANQAMDHISMCY